MTKLLFRLDKSQRKELGKYWFAISEIVIGSMVLKLFEPGAPEITFGSIIILCAGLTIALLVAILGLRFTKEIKR